MSLFRRNRDLDDEIAAHVRMALRDRLDGGEKYDDALQAVRREFGNEAAVKEITRGMWGWTWLETLLSDLRYAARGIRKSPAWAAAVAVSLAFGIGANTAIFSLTYAIVLKNLPIPQPSRLIRYGFRNGAQDIGLSGRVYEALRHQQSACIDLLAWSDAEFSLDENGQTRPIKGGLLSGTGFRVLRLQPALGTGFADGDDVSGGGPRGYQALISYAWWKTHFHQSPTVIGSSLRLNGRSVTISGVLPPGFDGLIAGSRADLVLPLSFEEVTHATHPIMREPGAFWLSLFGRLKPGQSVDSARANLAAIETSVRKAADSKQAVMGFFKPFRIVVEPGGAGRSFLRGIYERPLQVLEMLAALVMVLCCANTALLVLAQMSSRAREFALRTAIGAPRLRLVRLVLLEILMLAAIGLVLAIGLGWSVARSLTAMLVTVDSAPAIDVTPHAIILAFTAVLTFAAALGTGLISAVRISRTDPAATLKQASRTSVSRTAGGRWIVPAQVSVSVTLIAAALLLGASFLNLYLRNSGFQYAGVTFAEFNLGSAKMKDPQLVQAAQQIVSQVGALPGVSAASYLTPAPMRDWWAAGHFFSVDGHGGVHTDMALWPETVTNDYFAAMGTRIIEGQPFQKDTLPADRTCILSQTAAQFFFPGENAIGKSVYSGGADAQKDGSRLNPEDACRVIGIAENASFRSLREVPPRAIYKLLVDTDATSQFAIAARGGSDSDISAAVREIVRRVAPAAPAPKTYRFTEVVDDHLNKERMLIRLSACFGGCALMLTAIGLYGLLMRNVTQRTPEIGIRMALGASRRSAMTSVLGMALRHVVLGLVAGEALAVVAGRAMESLLYGVTPRDPRIYIGAGAVVLATALVATLLPALRAASVDPAEALRTE